jgi:hypothetical protein
LVVDQIASGVPDVPLFQKGVATMITKECFGCEKVTSHEHLHDCLVADELQQPAIQSNSAPVKQHAHGELIALRNPPDQHFV